MGSDRDTAKCKLSKGITIQTTMGAEQRFVYGYILHTRDAVLKIYLRFMLRKTMSVVLMY